jgi:hypothetical protein
MALNRALRVGLIYLAASAIWIVFSDRILFGLSASEDFVHSVQTLKGLLFVTLSAGLVTGLAWRELRRTRELQRSAERYDRLFAISPLPMWVFDRETLRFLEVNEAAVERYGWSRNDFLQMTLEEIRPREGIDELHASVGATPESGVHEAGIFRHRTREGETLLARITSHRVRFDDRDAELVVAEDVTDRLETEAQLRQAQRMESVGRLAGGVAHDFNNLLTVIGNLAAMALEDTDPDSAHAETYRQIEAAQQRGAALTRQLLTFSRKVPEAAAATDATETLRRMGQMLPPLLGERIEVHLDLPDAPLPVPLTAVYLEQIAMNLAVNARDAMPDGGQLRLRLARRDDGDAPAAVLTVSDTGTGMTARVQQRIFEPFFTTKEASRGTGLGLSTTYGLVTGAGGEIAVASEPGRGTTFTVRLPLEETGGEAAPAPGTGLASEPPAASPKAPPPAPGGNGASAEGAGATVLVVEDEPALRTIMRKGLHRQGHRVLEASSGSEALALLAESDEPVHLVISDLVMPEMDGAEFLRRVARMRPGVPSILVSGYGAGQLPPDAELPTDQRFLAKPFAMDELARAVDGALES